MLILTVVMEGMPLEEVITDAGVEGAQWTSSWGASRGSNITSHNYNTRGVYVHFKPLVGQHYSVVDIVVQVNDVVSSAVSET